MNRFRDHTAALAFAQIPIGFVERVRIGPARRSVFRALALLTLLTLGACVSLPHDAVTWHGYTEGRIKVRLSLVSTLPVQGWLVESEPEQASGFISFTKWGSARFRYKKRAYFRLKDKWEAGADYLGRMETRDGSSEFCTANPEHGGYQEGNKFVTTTSYDYCAWLSRR